MTVNPYQPPSAALSPAHHTTSAGAPPLWNPNAIGNWSLLFTPVFGASLVSKNWKALGEHKRAANARVWLYIAPPLILIGLAFPLLIIWYFASNRPQARFVKERWAESYPRQPWGKPLAIACAVYALFFVILIVGVMSSTPGAP